MKALLPLLVIVTFVFAAGLSQAEVVINEVMYHPGGNDGDGDLQWIELYNPGPQDVDIGGWILANHPLQSNAKSRDLIFPAGIVIPHDGYVLLVNDLDDSKDYDGEYFAKHWNVPVGIQVIEYGRDFPLLILGPEGDDLHLSADGQEDADAMWYGHGGEMGAGGASTVASGASLGRRPNGKDSDDPAADFVEFSHPTPGASNQSAPVSERSTWSKIKLLFR
jgi:hypothetical protein